MAWNGLFLLDGSELVNVQRTEQYAENFGISWLKELYSNRDLSMMYDGVERYKTPLVDNAPWVDPDDTDSQGFLGFYPIDITGIEDSTASSTVIEYTTAGGSPGRLRHATRAVVFSGVLVANSTASAEYGMRWLRQVLLSGPCSGNRATLTCSGADLCYLSSDPELPDGSTEVEANDCLTPYWRTLRQFAIVSPPVVGNKLPMSDGSEGWLVQFTGTAGVPFEFGPEIGIVEGYLDPDVTDPWVGDVPAGVIDFDGRIVQETPCLQQVWEPLYDPLCPAGVPPPGPVDVPMGCFDLPSNWRRRQLVIPEEMIPLWDEVVPTIAVRTRKKELRNLRLRFYADPYKVENPDIDPCGYCGDILISYIPVDATMTFDGGLQAVFVDLPGGVRRRADSLVFNTEGKPFEWPALSCGFQYVVTFDLPQTQQAPIIDLSLTPRMV